MNSCIHKNKRVVWVFRLLFLVVISGTFSSCATFNKKIVNPTRLDKSNLEVLNGTYSIASTQSDSISDAVGYKDWYYHNFFKEIDRKLIKDTLVLDSTKVYAFRLQVQSHKSLQIEYLVNDSVFRKRTIKTKITRDGYLKLKNKNIQLLMVPYVFGVLDIKRTRVTIDAAQNLLFEASGSLSGGFVLMMGGNSYINRKTYKRIRK